MSNETNNVTKNIIVVGDNIRSKSLEWFFILNEFQQMELKEKYFNDTYIEYSNQWGYHYTLGQIEEMYKKEFNVIINP